MPKTVWKFPLEVTETQTIELPEEAQLLSVQTQHNHPQLWALVDPELPKRPVTILIFDTGEPIEGASLYLGTFQCFEGTYVGHAFLKA